MHQEAAFNIKNFYNISKTVAEQIGHMKKLKKNKKNSWKKRFSSKVSGNVNTSNSATNTDFFLKKPPLILIPLLLDSNQQNIYNNLSPVFEKKP